MTEDEIELKVQTAIDKLLDRDALLLQNDAAERAITAKLSCYIQEEFDDWDVDCEYNRNFHRVKRLKEICKSKNKENGASVFPDIIVHQRMTEHNFIVVEVKKTTNTESSDCDLMKLEAFREELGYEYGLFIRFKAGVESVGVEEIVWVY
ncbi:MAG: hypothetical protein AB2687_09725 [Candidatus Thiodiazotropha taylori]